MQKKIFIVAQEVRRLLGTKLLLLFFSVVPLGVLTGIAEVALSFSLQHFLAAFHLIPMSTGPTFPLVWLVAHPTTFIFLVIALQAVVNFFTAVVPGVAYEGFNSRIRGFIATHAFGTEQERGTFSIGDVGQILSITTPKVAVFFSACTQFLSTGFLLLTILTGMLFLSTPLTGAALGAVFLLGIPTLILKSSFQKFSSAVYAQSSAFTHRMLRNIRNIYFLRVVGTLQDELRALRELNRSILQNYVRYIMAITANTSWPVFAGMLIVIGVVIVNDRTHALAPSFLIPFVYLFTRFSSAIARLVASVGQLQFSSPFFQELLQTYTRLSSPLPTSSLDHKHSALVVPQRLRVDDLTVGRTTGLAAEINLTLQEGDFLLVSGKSGRGKTTLLMTLVGVVPKRSGQIFWNGIPIEAVDVRFLKQHVGYAGADPFLFDGSLEENLLYGASDASSVKKNIVQALSIAQCSFVDEFDGGVHHRLREGGEGISAGQKQRLAIARAILHAPTVLLLDEATSNIDEGTEKKIILAIRSLLPKTLVVAVSHRRSLRQFATHHFTFD